MGKSSLIMVLGFMVVFGSIRHGLYQKGVRATDNFINDYEQTQALNIARSGFEIAVRSLVDSTCEITELSMFGGSCSVARQDSAGSIYLTVTGGIGDITHTLEAVLTPPMSPLDFAGFGKNSVTMSGSAENDSYDSRLGPYGGDNVGAEGDVGTNGTTADVISLSGSAKVTGDVSTGSGGTVKETGGSTVISGDITHDNAVDFPDPTVPADLVALPSSGDIFLTGSSTQTLALGDYKFSRIKLQSSTVLNIVAPARIYLTGSSGQAIKMSSSSVINILGSGTVEFYCDADVQVSSSGVINPGEPSKLWLYGTSLCNDIKWSSSSSLSGVVYAPNADIQLTSSSEVFGCLAGKTISMSSSAKIHRDIALSEVDFGGGGGSSDYALVSLWE